MGSQEYGLQSKTGWSGKPHEKDVILNKDLKEAGKAAIGYVRNSIPVRGNSQCKSREAGAGLVCLRHNEGASVAATVNKGGTRRGLRSHGAWGQGQGQGRRGLCMSILVGYCMALDFYPE